MQVTGQNNGGMASSAFLLARTCSWLTRTCIMNMRNATRVVHKPQRFRLEWPFCLFSLLWYDILGRVTLQIFKIIYICAWWISVRHAHTIQCQKAKNHRKLKIAKFLKFNYNEYNRIKFSQYAFNLFHLSMLFKARGKLQFIKYKRKAIAESFRSDKAWTVSVSNCLIYSPSRSSL